MVLIVEHDVMIETIRLNGKKKEKMKERRTIRKAINMIDVSCKMLGAYIDLGYTENPVYLLATDKCSLRCIFLLLCSLESW